MVRLGLRRLLRHLEEEQDVVRVHLIPVQRLRQGNGGGPLPHRPGLQSIRAGAKGFIEIAHAVLVPAAPNDDVPGLAGAGRPHRERILPDVHDLAAGDQRPVLQLPEPQLRGGHGTAQQSPEWDGAQNRRRQISEDSKPPGACLFHSVPPPSSSSSVMENRRSAPNQ